jgi:transcriptional regulator with XRE-family HTH domain
MADKYNRLFKEVGSRYRKARLAKGMVQEDVLEHGFSVRHYQQLEAGRAHSITALLRVCEMFSLDPAIVMKGLATKKTKR